MKIQATLLALGLALFALPGCQTHAHAHHDEDEVHVVADVDDDCHGVLSCTADVVGDVVMLPFRIVGGIIDFIF